MKKSEMDKKDRIKFIKSMRSRGVTYKKIANKLNVSIQRIGELCKENGIKKPASRKRVVMIVCENCKNLFLNKNRYKISRFCSLECAIQIVIRKYHTEEERSEARKKQSKRSAKKYYNKVKNTKHYIEKQKKYQDKYRMSEKYKKLIKSDKYMENRRIYARQYYYKNVKARLLKNN